MEKKDIVKKTLKIKGMTCKSCSKIIEKRVGALQGVSKVKVDLANDTAHLEYDKSKVDTDTIQLLIKGLGYSAKVDSTNESISDTSEKTTKKDIRQGIMYGLIPHIGCIAFIVGSVLGVTVLMQFFRPLMMNRYFFYILIGISVLFATLSAVLYLRKNKLLSMSGAKRKWKYLATMYGSTVGINVVLFFLIFPMLANVSFAGPTGAALSADSTLQMKVDIPCPGHAPLISEELKTVEGVADVKFSFPNNFDVLYDSATTSKENMLALEVFQQYPATITGESADIASPSPLRQVEKGAQAGSSAGSSCSAGGGSCGCGAY